MPPPDELGAGHLVPVVRMPCSGANTASRRFSRARGLDRQTNRALEQLRVEE